LGKVNELFLEAVDEDEVILTVLDLIEARFINNLILTD